MTDLAQSIEGETDERPIVLHAENVSKRFCRDLKRSLAYGVVDMAREAVGHPVRTGELWKSEFWALRDIALKLERGMSLGLVGKNGCGKTTLMRVLSGLIKPTLGQVRLHGRLAPLLSLGAGFNTVLTGRENIYTNMSVLGLTKDEIDARFEDVVKFSEIEYALEAPVQNFSAGMVGRLGFACAINTDPDVLLVDEVLAVGDLKFREKCAGALVERHVKGMSLILVHHSPDMIKTLCSHALFLKEGRMVAFGDVDTIIDMYEEDLQLIGRRKIAGDIRASAIVHGRLEDDHAEKWISRSDRDEDEGLDEDDENFDSSDADDTGLSDEDSGSPSKITHMEMSFPSLAASEGKFTSGQDLEIEISFGSAERIGIIHFTLRVDRIGRVGKKGAGVDPSGRTDETKKVLILKSRTKGKLFSRIPPGEHRFGIRLPHLAIRSGIYRFTIDAERSNGDVVCSAVGDPIEVTSPERTFTGLFWQEHDWKLLPDEAPGSEPANESRTVRISE